MAMLKLFHLGGRWLALDGDALVAVDDYPSLDVPTLVISDFDYALTGAMSLEASPGAAAALIERKLRDEGLVEGESWMEIASLVRIGDGFRALYSAVPVADWQRMASWAAEGGDHRLVVTLLTVAKRLLQPGQAVILRHGKQLTWLAIDGDNIQTAEALAYSQDDTGVCDSATALADRVLALGGPLPDAAVWYALDAQPGQDDAVFAQRFAEASKIEVSLAPRADLTLEDGSSIQSALPALAGAARAGDASGQARGRFLKGCEQALPWAAGVAVVLALVFGLFAWQGWHQGAQRQAEADDLRAQASHMRQASQVRLDSLRGDLDALREEREFVAGLAAASAGVDMRAVLARVRAAARGRVRILRLHMDDAGQQLLVEGALADGPHSYEHLGDFIAALRVAGFQPQAAAAPLGSQSADYFAYSLLADNPPAAGELP